MFTPQQTVMVKDTTNNQTCFFTINHITCEGNNKHIYGIRLNNASYFLCKTMGVTDAEQLDTNPPLSSITLLEIEVILTAMEQKYNSRQPLEVLNREVFKCLVQMHSAA